MQKNLFRNLRKKVFPYHQKNFCKPHHKPTYIKNPFYALHFQPDSNQPTIYPISTHLHFPDCSQNHHFGFDHINYSCVWSWALMLIASLFIFFKINFLFKIWEMVFGFLFEVRFQNCLKRQDWLHWVGMRHLYFDLIIRNYFGKL